MASFTPSLYHLCCSSSHQSRLNSIYANQSTLVSPNSAPPSRSHICSSSPIFHPLVSGGPSFGTSLKKSALAACPQLHTSFPIVVNGKPSFSAHSKRISGIVSFSTSAEENFISSAVDLDFLHLTKNSVDLERKRRRTSVPRLKSSQGTESSTETEAEAGNKEEDRLGAREATAAATVAIVTPDTEAISRVLETVEEQDAIDEDAPVGSFISEELAAIYAKCQTWRWKDKYSINYVVQGSGPAVVLVHGFGASIGHWRRNIGVLSESNTVYALDLLGLGASEKPPKFVYTMETWAELLIDFLKDVVGSPAVLVGNSIGSLACLIASADAPAGLVRGTVLLNCAGGMNNKAVTDDWRLKLALPLLWLIDFVLNRPSIAARLFNRIRSRANIKSVLQSVYNNKEAVDDELVEVILAPADTPGALDAFVAIITGPPGPKPQTLMPKICTPVLLIWGDDDPFTPIDGPVGKYFSALATSAPNVQLDLLPNLGHCPHDDRPELVHEKLVPWLANLAA